MNTSSSASAIPEYFEGRIVCVTGGASFIGSHLTEGLVAHGAQVTVVDDFSSGTRENLEAVADQIRVIEGDLRELSFTVEALRGAEVVFHLAASHGGRGYIETHPADCASNMLLDGSVLRAAHLIGADRVCMASSACVYPVELQAKGQRVKLAEEMADLAGGSGASSDGEYGWAKLMGEMSLAAYVRQYGLKGVSCRIFTAYGERENPTHAIIALILRTLLRQDPYAIWGDGTQARNFTYVGDLVAGLMAAAVSITDGSPVNLGSEIAWTTLDVARMTWELSGWSPTQITYESDKPIGVHYRTADGRHGRERMGWSADTTLEDGLRRTMDWVEANVDLEAVRDDFEVRLLER